MTHHKQGSKRNCGQIAVAVLTDKTVEEVEALVGHSHGTKTGDLSRVIRLLGYSCGKRCLPFKPGVKLTRALAQMHKPGYSGWHWVAVIDDAVYDGHFARPFPLAEYTTRSLLIKGAVLTSYLLVNLPIKDEP